MIKIESPDNKNYKLFKTLLSSKGLKKKEGHGLVMGERLTKELKKKQKDFKTIHFEEDKNPDYLLSKTLFDGLSTVKTNSEILLVPFEQPKPFEPKQDSFDVYLPVGDPKNLGALIRTSLAFDVDRIVLLEESAHPYLPESIRSSSGAVFKAPLFKGPSLKSLNTHDIWTLDKNGENLYKWAPPSISNLKILIGEEGGHLEKKHLTKSLSIPISNEIESLNVNSALSVTLSWIKGHLK